MKRPNRMLINKGWQFSFEGEPPTPIDLPHSWNAEDTMNPDLAEHYRRGVGVYTYTIPPSMIVKSDRLWLEIEAASQKAQVYLNNQFVGEHLGGYIPFTLEITPHKLGLTADKALELRIEVDNRPDIDLIPSDMSDFFLYGGLTRNVWLYKTGANHIESLHITPSVEGRVSIVGQVSGGEAVTLRISDPSGNLLTEMACIVHEKTFQANAHLENVKLWSPDTPHLYRVSARLNGSDILQTQFAFREFSFPPGQGFYLNGERLLLRGTHRHEDWAGYASAVPDDISRHELALIKEAGFNFIRSGHYPQAPAVLEACDEIGLLVWLELPWCRGGIGGEVFRQQTRNMLVEMIRHYYNHPSIIFWGLGNELDWESEHADSSNEKVAAFLQELHDLSHQLDPTRLTALRRFEPGATIVDVYSPSIWSGWYRGRYQDYELALTDALKKYPNFFHAEWGGDSHFGRFAVGDHIQAEIEVTLDHAEQPGVALSSEGFARASRDSDWSESYMLDVMEWHLQIQNRLPNLSGSAQWIFSDFGTPLRPENPIPYVNQKGLIDRGGRKKSLFYLFKSYQSDEPVCYIESPHWQARVGSADERQRVRVYSNCETVTLFVNDIQQETLTRDASKFPAAGLVWWVSLVDGANTIRAEGVTASGETITHEIEQELIPPRSKEASQFVWGGDGCLQLADDDGCWVISPEQFVQLEVISGGKLAEHQGTVDGSRRVQTANGRISLNIERDEAPLSLRLTTDNFQQELTLYKGERI